MNARTMSALVVFLVALVALDQPAFSTAAFTSSSTNTGSVRAAADWTPPTVTMVNPGSPIKGTVTLTANASDPETGIASVAVQYLPSGGASWIALCTTAMAPYSCSWDTRTAADGAYSFRAVATDNAGYTTTSQAVTDRFVDNRVSSVSMRDPGSYLAGPISLTADAASTAGVSAVHLQIAPSGTTAWSTLCTVTTSPYSCTWNSATVADGSYDFRAVLVDGATKEAISAIVASRRVDNSPLRGRDVQAVNGSTATGRMEGGDTVTFTYSRLVNLATVTPGWNGEAIPVTLRAQDGSLLGLSTTGDTIDVLRTGNTVNLGSVNLGQDYVQRNKTVSFNSTMTASIASVDGVPHTVITVHLGSQTSTGGVQTVSIPGSTVWTPNGAAKDLFGKPASTAPVTETGVLDTEF